jgi:thiol-disulfide isomerase/thioredoxin
MSVDSVRPASDERSANQWSRAARHRASPTSGRRPDVRRVFVLVAFGVLAVGAVAVSRRTSADVVAGVGTPSATLPVTASVTVAPGPAASAAPDSPSSPSSTPPKETGVPSTPSSVPVLTERVAPDLGKAAGWVNSPALGPAELTGKVVLYDFWTFECVNCQHTFPWVEAWHERYAQDGLVVASIHTPEFAFEADPGNVRKAVLDDGLTYPVALDPDRAIWKAYGNHYWPAFYVYDREGRLRYERVGEGSYDKTEDTLRTLLGVDPSSPRAGVHPAS